HFTIADGLGLDRDAEIPGDPGEDANGNDDSAGSDDANGGSGAGGTDGSSDAGGSEDSEGSADSAGSHDADAAGGGATGNSDGGEAMARPAAVRAPDWPETEAECCRAPVSRSVPRSSSASPRSSADRLWSAWPSAAGFSPPDL